MKNSEDIAMQQLRTTLGKMEAALGVIDNAIVWADAQGKIQWCNAIFDRLVLPPDNKALGKDIVELLPLEQGGKPVPPDSHPAKSPAPTANGAGVYEFRQKDQTLTLEIAANRVQRDEDDGSVVLAIRDITQRIKLEQGLQEKTKVLEENLREQRRQYKVMMSLLEDLDSSQEKLKQQEKLKKLTEELTRSNAELEQFAYIASHDLQEPLRKIASFTELLSRKYKGHFDAQADKYVEYVVDGATRMQTLIQDLLAYSRIGKGELALGPVDFISVMKQVMDNLAESVRESGAVVAWNGLPTGCANVTQMTQLLQNLVGNAVKYRKKGAVPHIDITARKENNAWLFAVKDNGIGMDPQYAQRIFEIFQRLHTRAEYPGTGIGLAVCKKIVERHQGKIWVESQLGQGATFFFTLPA